MENTKIDRSSISSVLTFVLVSALIILVIFAIIGPLVLSATTTNTVNAVTATLSVPGVCIPGISNTVIQFSNAITPGYVQPGSFAATTNDVNVVDFGQVGANILVDANSAGTNGNWISSAGSFWVYNTLWSPTSGGNIGTQMTNAITGVDTWIPVKPNGSGNDIFFGLNVPVGQAAGSYNQVISILLGC